MAKRNKSRQRSVFPRLASTIDLASGGYNKFIYHDFILDIIDPYNANIGYLNPKDLHTYDQDFINSLIKMEPDIKLPLPSDLESISNNYVKQRVLLSNYHNKAESEIIKYDIDAAKELKNFDEYTNKVVVRNEAELIVLYDYIALYRKIKNKRTIVHWRSQNLKTVNSDNKKVVDALENSSFAILRLDKNLSHGIIKATNIITKQELILIDKALNASEREGCFFICSLLDMNNYAMTSGGGIPIDPTSPAGKLTLTLSKKYLDKLRSAKSLNNNVIKCVREIYGFCLRVGALVNMTISQVN